MYNTISEYEIAQSFHVSFRFDQHLPILLPYLISANRFGIFIGRFNDWLLLTVFYFWRNAYFKLIKPINLVILVQIAVAESCFKIFFFFSEEDPISEIERRFSMLRLDIPQETRKCELFKIPEFFAWEFGCTWCCCYHFWAWYNILNIMSYFFLVKIIPQHLQTHLCFHLYQNSWESHLAYRSRYKISQILFQVPIVQLSWMIKDWIRWRIVLNITEKKVLKSMNSTSICMKNFQMDRHSYTILSPMRTSAVSFIHKYKIIARHF